MSLFCLLVSSFLLIVRAQYATFDFNAELLPICTVFTVIESYIIVNTCFSTNTVFSTAGVTANITDAPTCIYTAFTSSTTKGSSTFTSPAGATPSSVFVKTVINVAAPTSATGVPLPQPGGDTIVPVISELSGGSTVTSIAPNQPGGDTIVPVISEKSGGNTIIQVSSSQPEGNTIIPISSSQRGGDTIVPIPSITEHSYPSSGLPSTVQPTLSHPSASTGLYAPSAPLGSSPPSVGQLGSSTPASPGESTSLVGQVGSSTSSSPSVIPSIPPTAQNCGLLGRGSTCSDSLGGDCCSEYDFCGDDSAHCGAGCQPAFGICWPSSYSPSSSSMDLESSSLAKSTLDKSAVYSISTPTAAATTTISSIAQPTQSVYNGRCGSAYGGATCWTSPNGGCCSEFDWCGSGTEYCGTGCQWEFGTCGLPAPLSAYPSSSSTPVVHASVTPPLYVVEPTTTSTSTSTVTLTTTVAENGATTSTVTCAAVTAPAPTLLGTTSYCCRWYTVQYDDTCATIDANFDLDPGLLQLLNPQVDGNCDNLAQGAVYCISGAPPDSTPPIGFQQAPGHSSHPPGAQPTTPITFVVLNSFHLRAENSGTPSDGTLLMAEDLPPAFLGFWLHGSTNVPSFTLDSVTDEITPVGSDQALFINPYTGDPPVVRSVVDTSINGAPTPLKCSITSDMKLECSAHSGYFHQFQLIDEGNDGPLDLALGDGVSGDWIAGVDLYVVPL